jgi:hypothetical protein
MDARFEAVRYKAASPVVLDDLLQVLLRNRQGSIASGNVAQWLESVVLVSTLHMHAYCVIIGTQM